MVPELDKANEHSAKHAQRPRSGANDSVEWASTLPVPPSEAVLDDFICGCHNSALFCYDFVLLSNCILLVLIRWLFRPFRFNYAVLSLLVGNDFLPHLPSLHIHEGAMDELLET